MPLYVVTVKDPKNPDHDPSNKKTGSCTVTDFCTDMTGAHHSFVVITNRTPDEIKKALLPKHVTRIEEAIALSWREMVELNGG